MLTYYFILLSPLSPQQSNYVVVDHSGIKPLAPIRAPSTTIYGEVDHVKTAQLGQQLNTPPAIPPKTRPRDNDSSNDDTTEIEDHTPPAISPNTGRWANAITNNDDTTQ